MKKITVITFIFILALSCLTSCDITNDILGGHNHTYREWDYDEFKHWREYTCGCNFEVELGTHTNEDGDEFCDICGCKVGFKSDYALCCQYYYTNEYGSNTHTQVSLDCLDFDVIVNLSTSLQYTDEKPASSRTKIEYCIRHYDTKTDPFLITGNEQYLNLSGNFTNEYADVTYFIDYVDLQIERCYTTPRGKMTEYAKLSSTQLDAVKETFREVANILEPNI